MAILSLTLKNLSKMRKRILVDTATNNRVQVRPSIDRKIHELKRALGKPLTPRERAEALFTNPQTV
jgi:hypothetical protein